MLLSVLGSLLGLPLGFVVDKVSAFLAGEWSNDPEHDALPAGASATEQVDSQLRVPWALGAGSRWRSAVVIVAAGALVAVAWRLYGDHPWQAGIVSYYISVLLACTVTDLIVRRIADVITYPAIGFAMLIALIAPGSSLVDVLGGGILAGGTLFAFALLPGGGLGDAKLGLFMGLALGIQNSLWALEVMALTGGAVSLTILVASRMRAWKMPVSYGPFIALGMLVVILLKGTAFRTL